MSKPSSPTPKLDQAIPGRIFTVRGRQVILDADLANIYGVATRVLNQAVKRHPERFPEEFAFALTRDELESISQIVITSEGCDVPPLRSQAVISKSGRGGRRSLPYAFSEHGAIMAATVLNSPEAVRMSLFVIRAFVKLREERAANAAILKRLAEIDKTLLAHDAALRDIYQKLLPLLAPPPDPPRREIGFHVKEQATPYRVRRRLNRPRRS